MPAEARRTSIPTRATRRSPPPYTPSPLRTYGKTKPTDSPSSLGYSNIMRPGPYGTAHVSTSPMRSIIIPAVPDEKKQKELRKIQRISSNLTSYREPGLLDQVAYPTDAVGNIVSPEDLAQHSVDYEFELPRCFHNVPIRIFKAQSTQFKGLWCGACYLKKAEGYCKFWSCISNILESPDIQFYLYPMRNSNSIPRLQYPTIPNPNSTNTEPSSTPEKWRDVLLSTPTRQQLQHLDIAERNEVEDELMPPSQPSSHSPVSTDANYLSMSTSFRSPASSQESTEFKAPFTQRPNDSPMSIAQDSPTLSQHFEDVFMLPSTENSTSALPSTPPKNPSPPSQIPSLSHDSEAAEAINNPLHPQTPPSPSPQPVNGSEVEKPAKKRVRMKQGLFLPSPHDKDWKWQAKLAADEAALKALGLARKARFSNPSSLFITGSPTSSTSSLTSSESANYNYFSGFALELPPSDVPYGKKASNLWVPPPAEAFRFTLDVVPYAVPKDGYQRFLNNLGTSHGVAAEEFWDAFVICRPCNRIVLGELFVDHKCF